MSADALLARAVAWGLTYLIHSTVLAGAALLAHRARLAWRGHPLPHDTLWRAALVGPLLTATLQPFVSLPLRQALGARGAGLLRAGLPLDATMLAAAPDAWRALASYALALATAAGMFVAAIRVGALVVAHLGFRRRIAGRADHPALGARARRIADGLPVRVTVSAADVGPVALGFGEICLPARAASELSTPELDAVLAHEIAHLRRRDPLWLWAAAVIERALWVQPLNRVLAARLRASAELRCDEWAVRRVGEPAALASALVRVAGWSLARPAGALAAFGSATERGDSLAVERVRRLLSAEAPTAVRAPAARGMALCAAALAASAVLLPGFTAAPSLLAVPSADELYTISAFDDAGPFTVTLRGGRVLAASVGGAPLDPARIRQIGDRIVLADAAGRPTLDLAVTPYGGIRWTSRSGPHIPVR